MWSLLVGEWRVRQLAVALVCLKPGIGLCLIFDMERHEKLRILHLLR